MTRKASFETSATVMLVRGTSDAERHRATLRVCQEGRTVEERRELLQMLGLLDDAPSGGWLDPFGRRRNA